MASNCDNFQAWRTLSFAMDEGCGNMSCLTASASEGPYMTSDGHYQRLIQKREIKKRERSLSEPRSCASLPRLVTPSASDTEIIPLVMASAHLNLYADLFSPTTCDTALAATNSLASCTSFSQSANESDPKLVRDTRSRSRISRSKRSRKLQNTPYERERAVRYLRHSVDSTDMLKFAEIPIAAKKKMSLPTQFGGNSYCLHRSRSLDDLILDLVPPYAKEDPDAADALDINHMADRLQHFHLEH